MCRFFVFDYSFLTRASRLSEKPKARNQTELNIISLGSLKIRLKGKESGLLQDSRITGDGG